MEWLHSRLESLSDRSTQVRSAVIGGLVVLALTAIYQTIVSDWWHSVLLPVLRRNGEWPIWAFALLLVPLVSAVVLYISRERLLRENAVLHVAVDSHTANIVEHDVAVSRARNSVLEAMHSRVESTVVTLINLATELAEGEREVSEPTASLLRQSIDNIIHVYGGRISRGLILIHDPSDEDWLKCCASVNIEGKSIERRHYVGPMNDLARRAGFQRGVAGNLFLMPNPKPVVVHVERPSKKASRKEYVDYRKDRLTIPYQSFIAYPLRLDPKDKRAIGVLCLDSPFKETFDGDPSLESVIHLIRIVSHLVRFTVKVQVVRS